MNECLLRWHPRQRFGLAIREARWSNRFSKTASIVSKTAERFDVYEGLHCLSRAAFQFIPVFVLLSYLQVLAAFGFGEELTVKYTMMYSWYLTRLQVPTNNVLVSIFPYARASPESVVT